MEVREFRAGVRAWIDEVGEPLVPAIEDQSVDAQLHHQRQVQRLLFDAGWMRWGWPTRIGGLGARRCCAPSWARSSPAERWCTPRPGRCTKCSGRRWPSSAGPTWSRRSSRGYCGATNSGVRGSPSPTRAATWDRADHRAHERCRLDHQRREAVDQLGSSRHAVHCVGQDRWRRVSGYQRFSGGYGHTGRDREPAGDDGRCRRILLDVVRRRRSPRAASAR